MFGTKATAIAKPDHLKTGTSEIQPSNYPDFECFQISNSQILDPHYTSAKKCFVGSIVQQHFLVRLDFFGVSIVV